MGWKEDEIARARESARQRENDRQARLAEEERVKRNAEIANAARQKRQQEEYWNSKREDDAQRRESARKDNVSFHRKMQETIAEGVYRPTPAFAPDNPGRRIRTHSPRKERKLASFCGWLGLICGAIYGLGLSSWWPMLIFPIAGYIIGFLIPIVFTLAVAGAVILCILGLIGHILKN